MTRARIELPPKLLPVFKPARGEVRYRGAYGGRGSGKSYSFALMAAIFGYAEPLRILCTRELQVSIRESMYAEIKNVIRQFPWLEDHYQIGESYIRGANGTEFLFRGLRHNISTIKSMAQIDLAIVEEAEDVPESSWLEFVPTVRAPNSEIWVVWNPRTDGSPVDERFVKNPPDSSVIVKINAEDNPWLPNVLREEREHDRERMDPALFAHVWEGEYLEQTEAQVLGGKVRVEAFEPEPDWDGPYHGIDYGFAQDPTAAVRFWIAGDRLYVEREAVAVSLDLDDTASFVRERIPQAERYVWRADAARPESTSYLRRHGLPRIESAPKWQGSVEDGIAWLRSFKSIVIHPRCEEAVRESRLWSYKKDRNTGDVLPTLQDGYDHIWDAVRYGAAPMIRHPKRKAGTW